jgi:hypothetical protein
LDISRKKREKFEDTKGVIRSRKFKKDRYYDVQKKTDNDLQNTTHKRLIEQQVPHKTGGELWCSRKGS